MNEELKSLKNPTRILTAIMFFAVFVYSVGADGLAQILPGVPPVVLAGIVSLATFIVTQYGTEKRIVRAEELKDQEYNDSTSDSEPEELIEDGVWRKKIHLY